MSLSAHSLTAMRAPDPAFADPQQAALYDVFEHDRSDLDAYVSLVDEVGAQHVVDLGCGTGSLAVRLIGPGRTVVGVDPAEASLGVARSKPGAEQVTWIHGDARSLADRRTGTDLVVMTGNVAQVFVSDSDWHMTLAGVSAAVRPGGWFVFETRRPEVRDWENWTIHPTPISLQDGRSAVISRQLTDVAPPLISFESATTIDGVVLRSSSTLRFRTHDEITDDLARHGFSVIDVRDAPDRPGKEMVFLARATDAPLPQPYLDEGGHGV